MSLIFRMLQDARSWWRRRGGPKTAKRAAVAMERLDNRQLLSVNFTGNVAVDFPATQQPGVVIFNSANTPNIQHPIIPPDLQPLIPVSGFDISEIRVAYDPTDDTLNIGLNQPPSQRPGQPGPVIAGDADDNGDAGTVNPAVAAADPGFTEFPALGGPERMAAFIDLNGDGVPDIVAGFSSSNTTVPKPYEVAVAVPNLANPMGQPSFGTDLPNNTGNVYLFNSPAHPNLEFSISHFSQLYLSETGNALTPTTQIGIGAFAGSPDTIRISDAFFPESTFPLSQATPPPPTPPPPPPPVSPPVVINPHENRHINTAHPTDIRVSIFGTSGFDVNQIVPGSVTLGRAHPVFNYTRNINKDEWLDETFVFKGTDVHLPPGPSEGVVTGTLTNGQTFSTSALVFNRDDSYYPTAKVHQAQARQAANPDKIAIPIAILQDRLARNALAPTNLTNASSPVPTGVTVPLTTLISTPVSAQSAAAATGPVVRIKRREPVVAGRNPGSKVSARLHSSMNQFLQTASAASASAT